MFELFPAVTGSLFSLPTDPKIESSVAGLIPTDRLDIMRGLKEDRWVKTYVYSQSSELAVIALICNL